MQTLHMNYQFIITPYFLGEEKQELNNFPAHGCVFNHPSLLSSGATARINEVHASVREQVDFVLEQGDIPVSISGDCCTSMAVLAALQQNGHAPLLLWLDAHGDFNTAEITTSGFLGGMPLAMISGRGDQQFVNSVGLSPLGDADIILADGRDLDPAEKKLIESSAITWLKTIEAIKQYDFNGRPVYIHFDVDIIDANEAPAVLYPVPGGPGKEELAGLFQYLRNTQNICAVSVTPWEPGLDVDNTSRETCMQLLDILMNGQS
jgi:arginase